MFAAHLLDCAVLRLPGDAISVPAGLLQSRLQSRRAGDDQNDLRDVYK